MSRVSFPEFCNIFWSLQQSDTLQWAYTAGQQASDLSSVFAGAYRAALQALIPQLPSGKWVAMCVSEAGGNHPRNIQTRLEQGQLWGEKTYISMAEMAAELLVLCLTGEQNGRPVLKLVWVPASSAGVSIERLPALGLLQHIPHGRCHFAGVGIKDGQILPGDGYADYSKVFRIFEDIHVQIGLLGHVQAQALVAGLPEALVERAALLVFALKGIFAERRQATAELALADASRQTVVLMQEYLACDALPQAYRQEMQNDLKILGIARKAAAARREKAWQILRGEG